MEQTRADPILADFKAALEMLYGERLERVILFGSRARGEAHCESDYDVAVFLRAMENYWDESSRLSDVAFRILEEHGEVIQAVPFRAGSLQERTPLLFEIRKDGVPF